MATPVALVDVYPTVAAVAGLARRAGFAGRSLAAPEALRPAPIYAETFYARLHFGWSELASLVDGDLHYLHGPAPQLFDLTTDPGERHDELTARRRAYRTLRQRTLSLLTPLRPPGSENPETTRRLAALGYLGGSSRSDGPRPDPRRKLPVLADLQEGMRLAATDRFAAAAERLATVVDREPEMVDAWETLARARRGLGELEPALAAYRRALALSPGGPQLALGAAGVLLKLERPAEAAAHARLALDRLPPRRTRCSPAPRCSRGRSRRRRRTPPRVPKRLPPRPGRCCCVRRSSPPAAISTARCARSTSPRPVATGRCATSSGCAATCSPGSAAPAKPLRPSSTKIDAYPQEPRAYESALLDTMAGRPRQAVATLRRLLAAAETPRSYAAAVRTLRVLGDPAGAEALRRHALARFPESAALAAAAAEPAAGG